MRQDFLSALEQIGFLERSDVQQYSINRDNDSLVKAVIVGGLYPRVARIALPQAQFDRVQQGTILRDVSSRSVVPRSTDNQHEAKEVKYFDSSGRVFIHPSSILFSESGFKAGFLAYSSKAETSKVFLRDATEVRISSSLWLLTSGPVVWAVTVWWTHYGQPLCRRRPAGERRRCEDARSHKNRGLVLAAKVLWPLCPLWRS